MTASTQTPVAPSPQQLHHSHRWWVLAVVGTAQLMIVLDATIVNIALPSAQKDLGFANTDRQWIITAYALAFGSLLLLGGKLGDLFGRKWTFLGRTGWFRTGLRGRWGSIELRCLGRRPRALQGVFAALLAPSCPVTPFYDLH